jgi:ABC-type dipeptide/oligopeptide/nickel transport system permease component
MIIAVPFGYARFYISFKQKQAADIVITGISITGLSIPVFWSGLVLMLFSV